MKGFAKALGTINTTPGIVHAISEYRTGSLARRGMLALSAAAALATWMPEPARAQSDYPDRPVTLIVPFPAGGQSDLIARLITSKMVPILGQQIVVDNRGGAGGNIAAAAAAKADPDGYTLFLGFVGTHGMNPALYKKLPYDPIKDFAPISLLNITPLVLVANPDFPAKSVPELIEFAKAHPGEYSYASSGNGTPIHLAGELFKTMAGIDLVHVPYKGAAPALVDVLGGHVPLMFDNLHPRSSISARASCARSASRLRSARPPSRTCRPLPKRCRDSRSIPGMPSSPPPAPRRR
jgi:tripartite-type tricarboxylate transporter receptor subunit TctC